MKLQPLDHRCQTSGKRRSHCRRHRLPDSLRTTSARHRPCGWPEQTYDNGTTVAPDVKVGETVLPGKYNGTVNVSGEEGRHPPR
ncbi:MAG: hypothetical protein R2688_05490 [Fimbriimonadaceae bacterium]